jgi:hypothetical protein
MPDRNDVAQQIWQTYVAETGRSLPAGLADKLADAAIGALGGSSEVAVQTRLPVVDTTKRGTRLPEDWQPSDAMQTELVQTYPGVNFALILDEFRDYWCAVPGQRGLKLSWDRTFRNRVREVAHKPQYRLRDQHGNYVRTEMSKVDAKAASYLEG